MNRPQTYWLFSLHDGMELNGVYSLGQLYEELRDFPTEQVDKVLEHVASCQVVQGGNFLIMPAINSPDVVLELSLSDEAVERISEKIKKRLGG